MSALARHLALSLASLAPVFVLACGEEEVPPPPPPTRLAVTLVDAANGNPVTQARFAILSVTPLPGSALVAADDETSRGLSTRVPLLPKFGEQGNLSGPAEPGRYTVRVDAPGYAPLPEPFAPPVVIDVRPNIDNTAELRLEPTPALIGPGGISGRVTDAAGAGVPGVLIHAESTVAYSTLTDRNGDYAFLGLTSNAYRVEALVAGSIAPPRTNVDASVGEMRDIDFVLMPDTGATITATLGGSAATPSVAVTLLSTGDLVPGALGRATLGGEAVIGGVPAGRFLVQAALELDGRVVSPELLRRAMARPLVTVADGTDAYRVSLPIAPAMEGIVVDTSTAQAVPQFSWDAYPGAQFYVVEVRQLDGRTIWGGLDARGQPQFRINAPTTTAQFGTVSQPLENLVAGRAYRFRVMAGRDVPATGTYELMAASEELDGRFRMRR